MCAMTQIHMCHDSVAYVVAYHERQGSRLQGLGPWCSVCVCVVQGVVCVLGGGEASDLHREGFDLVAFLKFKFDASCVVSNSLSIKEEAE
mmetsp:Transcript_84663/g.137262  ORF Transcript_84663/g.137262 Transcript_84663/m.137262 type:complete len:90 (+) Transcript_84663:589-858(+)